MADKTECHTVPTRILPAQYANVPWDTGTLTMVGRRRNRVFEPTMNHCYSTYSLPT